MVELYVPWGGAAADRETPRAHRTAHVPATGPGDVVVRRTLLVPEDETCYVHLHAASAEAVCEAARHARLQLEHVAVVIASELDDATVSLAAIRELVARSRHERSVRCPSGS